MKIILAVPVVKEWLTESLSIFWKGIIGEWEGNLDRAAYLEQAERGIQAKGYLIVKLIEEDQVAGVENSASPAVL